MSNQVKSSSGTTKSTKRSLTKVTKPASTKATKAASTKASKTAPVKRSTTTAKAPKKTKVPSPPKARAKSGSAKAATALRINEGMTVQQLQDECRSRGVRGFSNKTKDWLLEQLGVESIWQTANATTSKTGGSSSKKVSSSSSSSSAKRTTKTQTATKNKGSKQIKQEVSDQYYYPDYSGSAIPDHSGSAGFSGYYGYSSDDNYDGHYDGRGWMA